VAEELNLDEFRATFQSGGFRSVSVVASAGSFFVTAQPRTGKQVTLATTHGKKRRAFRDAGKAIAILHELGARKVEVDTSDWSPNLAGTDAKKRPDTAERQRRAHAAAEHDAWFRAEVEQAIREADAPDAVWISNEEIKLEMAELRKEWRQRAEGEATVSR
jgi:formylmethanofuran dehydrogenase subunit E